ncbi:MAG: hypothetical protein IJB64_01540 [Akkermansia sp.]|nr:hypothetical protein [Akkermansia sp.]
MDSKELSLVSRLLLSLLILCGVSSCITFNTGAKLDSIGKAVPSITEEGKGQYYRLNGVVYREVMLSYVQQNPHLIGTVFMGYWDVKSPDTPASSETKAPRPQPYFVRMQEDRTDMPAFIPAADFDYARAQKIAPNEVVPRVIPFSYFKRSDWLTLTPSRNNSNHHLAELPTKRTLGNKLRLPVAVVLSYGVDAPLTAISYTVSSICFVIVAPFMW